MVNFKEKLALWIYALGVAIVAQIAPIIPLMLSVGLLITVDTIFGVWAAHKKKQVISSSGFSRLITKMFVYQTVIVTLFFYEKHITGDWIPLMKTAATMLSIVEVISILENSGIILDKPIFRFLINKLSSKSNKFGDSKQGDKNV